MDLINKMDETPLEDGSGKETDREKRAIFGLTDETDDNYYLKPDEEKPGQTYDFLRKLHIRNHELNANSSIHEFFSEEIEAVENDTDLLSEEDEYLFFNVGQAIAEHDIIDLRSNLQAISKTISAHQWSFEDIDKYLNSDLDTLNHEMIQNQSRFDVNLANDLVLFREIDEAIEEKDIMQLRTELGFLIRTESSHSRSLEEIEDYLIDELEESSKRSFEDDLGNNHNLASEVKLCSEINEALGEQDVMALRAALGAISKDTIEAGNQEIRSILSLKFKNAIWYIAAASVIILLGINVISRSYSYSGSKLYSEFYQPVECNPGTTRSAVGNEETMLYLALAKLNMKDYNTALKLFLDMLARDNQNSVANFYAGAIYQFKGQYADAIQSFKKVTENGDNLFIEQSNWYLGLCYLKLEQPDIATVQFQKISEGNGFYCKQSISILEKMD